MVIDLIENFKSESLICCKISVSERLGRGKHLQKWSNSKKKGNKNLFLYKMNVTVLVLLCIN